MESLVVVFVMLGFLIFPIVLCARLFLPREVIHAVIAEVIHDMLQGMWRTIFGAKKVRVVRDKNERVAGIKEKFKN